MKKVAILGTRGYPSFYGGFETAIRFIAPHLANDGWDVTVYGRPGGIEKTFSGNDRRIRSVLTKGLDYKSLSTLSFGLTSCIHAAIVKPDVALVMNVANGFWLPLLKARKIPVVVNVDGIEWEREKWGRLAKKVFKIGAKLTAKFADVLISDASEIQRIWREQFDRESTYIPYGGVQVGKLPVPDGLSSGEYVLMVARFVPENSVEEFFEAAKDLAKKTRVVIVGSTGYKGHLDSIAEQLSADFDLITWLGHVKDDHLLHALWQHAGVYFHGHSVGGTNPALVQAMACGAPVVARDTPYNKEVLGSAAVFVPPKPTAIYDAIEKVLQDEHLRRTFSAEVIQISRDRFNWARIAVAYEHSLQSVIEAVHNPRSKNE